MESIEKNKIASSLPEAVTSKLSVETTAKLMGVSKQFIRVGLQQKIFPFGYAVRISGNRFTYYISPKKFTEYTGTEVV